MSEQPAQEEKEDYKLPDQLMTRLFLLTAAGTFAFCWVVFTLIL